MHRFKFTPDDLFINRLKTYPEYNVSIYQGQMYVNKETQINGNGGITVYDINRTRTSDQRIVPYVMSSSAKDAFKVNQHQPLVSNHSGDFQWTTSYVGGQATQAITQSVSAYSDIPLTELNGIKYVIASSYSQESPISRALTSRINRFTGLEYYDITANDTRTNQSISTVPHNPTASALQNVAKKYITLSDHFIFKSSSVRSRDLVHDNNDINFIFIPNMYYGSSIKKGSVELNFYITGSKIASCADIKKNGELIGTFSNGNAAQDVSGSVVGLVMYDEGVIMLTSSLNLESSGIPSIKYEGPSTPARLSSWKYFGTTLNDQVDPASTNLNKTSFDLNFKGTNYVNSMTMFAHAKKGHLNHSNNPTYRDLETTRRYNIGSGISFYEEESTIANVVSASYVSASFEKTTYISKVHIYDEDGNLIAITSMAKPVKKTLNDEFTFKMKLDL